MRAMMRPTTSLAALAVLALAAGLLPPAAQAGTKARKVDLPVEALHLRYEMRVQDQVVGRPELKLGAVEHLKDGRLTRSLHVRAGTFGKVRERMVFDNTVVAMIDATTYQPMTSTIMLVRGDETKRHRLKLRGTTLDADVEAGGKRRDVKTEVAPGTTDVPGAVLWLQAAGLNAGERLSVPVHSGAAGYRLFATARDAETIEIPAGSFEAIPVDCALHYTQELETGSKAPHATFRVWFGTDAWRLPLRIQASMGAVGEIRFDVTHVEGG